MSVQVINRKLITDILFMDWQQRKAISKGHSVELLPISLIKNIRHLYSNRDSNRDWRILIADDLIYAISDRYRHGRHNELSADPIRELNKMYVDLRMILALFPGEIYCAGGVLFRAIRQKRMDSDCDLFFVNCTKERIDQILRQVYTILANKYTKGNVIGIRNQNTTTYCVWDESQMGEKPGFDAENIDQGLKYQFVHGRSYPSKEAIVIGFDLGTSALLYDGHEIYGTPLGIFCTALCVNILDPSRRSTSYEARILKYASLKVGLISIAATKTELNEYHGTEYRRVARTHELVKGIHVSVHHDFMALSPHGSKSAMKDSDYGKIETCLYWLHVSNARLAQSGKYDQMMWTGRSIEEIFERPQIKVYLGGAFEDYEDPKMYGSEVHVLARKCSQKNLAAWIGQSRVDQIKKEWPRFAPLHLPFDSYAHVIPELKEMAQKGANIAQEMALKGVSYIGPNDNPGRQYTSSFNPVYSNVRDYYGQNGIVTPIGIPDEVYWLLKCAVKASIGGYWKIPCQLIMEQLARLINNDLIGFWLIGPPLPKFIPKSDKKIRVRRAKKKN